MTGLDKILKQIEDDAKAEYDAAVNDAEKDAAKLLSDANDEENSKLAADDEKRKAEIELAVSRGRSAAQLQKRKMLLEAKQEIISEMIDSAKKTLKELPDKEYFDIILKMIRKYSLKTEGEVIFAERDLKRVPASFADGIKSFSLKISKETRNIDGGFVLLYGDIEENCSFDALFSAEKENLQDKVMKLLFE